MTLRDEIAVILWGRIMRDERDCALLADAIFPIVEAAIQAEREACARIVKAERDKLNLRWSPDSAYLQLVEDAIRAVVTKSDVGAQECELS